MAVDPKTRLIDRPAVTDHEPSLASRDERREGHGALRRIGASRRFLGLDAALLLGPGQFRLRRFRGERPGDAVPVALFSYVLGGVPALLTGAIAGRFRDELASRWHYLALGLAGGVLSVAFAGMIGDRPATSFASALGLVAMFGVPGVFGGTVIAILFRRGTDHVVEAT